MATGLVSVSLIGNIGRQPEKKYTQDGRPVTRFSLAATTRQKAQSGEYEDHTEWFNVTVFGRDAEFAGDRLNKGSRVYLEGSFTSRSYESNGKTGFSLDFLGQKLVALDPLGPKPETEAAPADLDDLPFG